MGTESHCKEWTRGGKERIINRRTWMYFSAYTSPAGYLLTWYDCPAHFRKNVYHLCRGYRRKEEERGRKRLKGAVVDWLMCEIQISHLTSTPGHGPWLKTLLFCVWRVSLVHGWDGVSLRACFFVCLKCFANLARALALFFSFHPVLLLFVCLFVLCVWLFVCRCAELGPNVACPVHECSSRVGEAYVHNSVVKEREE